MEVRHFKMVIAIAEAGSVTAAAERLFLTQPALSHQLKEIESQLGCQLFTRTNRKLVLTTAGKAFLNSSYLIVNEVDKLQADVKRIMTGETGRIRLATESSTCYHWLPRILKQFQAEFPNVEVQLSTTDVNQPLSMLLGGKVDVAIMHRKQTDRNIEYIDLFEDEVVALIPRTDPMSARTFLEPDDFRSITYITHSKSFDESAFFETFLKPHKVLPKKVIYIQLTEAVVEMVKEGLGIAVMANWLAMPYFDSHKLQPVRITRTGLKREWYIATLKTNNRPRYIESFIQHTRRSMLDHYKTS
ncbi:MAG TPA: LysR family transcriptional regulator [Cyclobacteriaceae bacterium]|nr:LysR family transcriptional regulator [Cyclobacteriaceae bacterium]